MITQQLLRGQGVVSPVSVALFSCGHQATTIHVRPVVARSLTGPKGQLDIFEFILIQSAVKGICPSTFSDILYM